MGLVAWATAITACSSPPTVTSTGEPSAPWFEPAEFPMPSPCASPAALAPRRSIPVDLFIGKSVVRDRALERFRQFAATSRSLGIILTPAAKATTHIHLSDLFADTHADVRKKHPNAAGNPSGRGAAEFLMEPVRAFISAHGSTNADRINVVFVNNIVPNRSALAGHLSRVAGLAFSPHLGTSGEAAELAPLIGKSSYRPTLFVAMAVTNDMSTIGASSSIMHEMGHALGLEHESDPANVMATARTRGCTPILREDQLATLRSTLERMKTGP